NFCGDVSRTDAGVTRDRRRGSRDRGVRARVFPASPSACGPATRLSTMRAHETQALRPRARKPARGRRRARAAESRGLTGLPDLDIGAFRAAPESAAGAAFVAALREACHGPGFCYLRGHGVPAEL